MAQFLGAVMPLNLKKILRDFIEIYASPDFIFGLKRANKYYIIFLDPKGAQYTDYEYRVDRYSEKFEENDRPNIFQYKGLQLGVLLCLYTDDKKKIPDKYRNYWYDNVDQIFKQEW